MSAEMIVYKKVRMLSDGKLYPLFINKRKPFEFNNWMHCEYHPTKGFKERSLGADEDGNQLGAWHVCFKPLAPHLSDDLASGEHRVWIECLAKGKHSTYDRPESMGGEWGLYEWIKPLRIVSNEEVEWMNS